jgi:hypothetical protein
VKAFDRLHRVLGLNLETWREVEIVNARRQVLRDIQVAFDERLADDHLDGDVAEFRLLPGLNLLAHRLEVPLHAVHANCDGIDQGKAL